MAPKSSLDGTKKKHMSKSSGTILVKVLLSGAATLFLALGLITRHLERRDSEHTRFYETGRSIHQFLSSYCQAMKSAHLEQKNEPLFAHYSASFSHSGRGGYAWSPSLVVAGVDWQERTTEAPAEGEELSPIHELAAELESFETLEAARCKIDRIEALEPGVSSRLTVKIILAGTDRAGRSVETKSFFRWFLRKEADAPERWRIVGDELVHGERVAGTRTDLVAPDPEALGIDFRHHRDPRLDMKRQQQALRFGVVQHSSGGIAAADYDGDERPDLLFLDGVRPRLYRNLGLRDGLPRFRDVTREEGLGEIGSAHSALWVDFDNDGDRDLFVARYLAPNRFYRNTGPSSDEPRFREESRVVGLDAELPSTSATVLDFDRDGFLDLYVAAFGNAFEAVPRLPFYATNGSANRLYRNLGGERFVDVTEDTGTGDTGWSLAVATADLDSDGWPDLAVANDFGRKTLLRNRGTDSGGFPRFEDVTRRAGALDFSGGMGLTFGDYDDDGRVDLYTSNIHSNQRWFGEDITVNQYLRNLLRSPWAVSDAGQLLELYDLLGTDWIELGQQIGEGNSLFRNRTGESLAGIEMEEVRNSHAERVGWGWGVAFFDADNDSDLDLYAANGWISNAPETDL